MGRIIRIGLVLTAAACLTAVLVDWVLEELNGEATLADIEAQPAAEFEQVSVEVPPAEVAPAEDATAELPDHI
jgi:hypothetical protein